MSIAAAIMNNLNVGLSRTKSLCIDGLDVLRNPTSTGNTFAVPIESIQVIEAGPGQVSGLSFVIEDPQGEVSIVAGQYVLFMDNVLDMPIFAGWVASYDVSAFGVGRAIKVECDG